MEVDQVMQNFGSRSNSFRVQFFAGLIALLVVGTAAGQAAPTRGEAQSLRAKLQQTLREWHSGGKAPGVNAALILADGTSIVLSEGVSDRIGRRPLDPKDKMLAGSTGKTIAAAVAMQLIAEGKLSLDDKIEKFFGREPWFGRLPNARSITVRQLMNHTSGLVRYEFKPEFTRDLTADPDKTWKPEELVAYLLDDPSPFESGKGWTYADTNYIVLGMVIEKITGKMFYDEAIRRVVSPLGLKNTTPQDSRTIKGLVQGYAGEDNPFGGSDQMIVNGKFAINPQFEWTGGGWASTAADLAHFAKGLYEGKAFDPELLPTVLDGVDAPQLGQGSRYGLGVIIRQTPTGRSYGHSGFFPGYMTDMMYFPETRTAIAVQVNTSVPRDLSSPLGRLISNLHAHVSDASR